MKCNAIAFLRAWIRTSKGGTWHFVLTERRISLDKRNFEKIVIKAYRWLSENWMPGDRIFLFGEETYVLMPQYLMIVQGFSRGAYQVRALAGMISKVGLIRRGNEEQIAFAYNVYTDPSSDDPPKARGGSSPTAKSDLEPHESNADTKVDSMAKRFKDTFSRDVHVHFVGVWDTVSSIGIVRGKSLPGTDSSKDICHFRHALALDERRVKFLPEYCRGGDGPKGDGTGTSVKLDPSVTTGPNNSTTAKADKEAPLASDDNSHSSTNMKSTSMPHVKEVWFTGTHSDIGGGNVSNPDMQRSSAPLLWMCYEAMSCGLKMTLHSVIWKWEELGALHESLTGVWKVFEYIPFKRLTYKNASPTTYRWHRGQGRIIQHGQKVHISVAFARDGYQPSAKYPKLKMSEAEAKWKSLLLSKTTIKNTRASTYKLPDGWEAELEMDVFNVSVADAVVKNLLIAEVDVVAAVHHLSVLTWSDDGRNTLNASKEAPRRVFNALGSNRFKDNAQLRAQILSALTSFAAKIPGLQNYELLEVLSPLLHGHDDDHSNIAVEFISKFCGSVARELLSKLGLRKSLTDTFNDEAMHTPRRNFIKIVLQAPNSSSEQSNLEKLINMAARFTPNTSKETQEMLQYCIAAVQEIIKTSLPHLSAQYPIFPPTSLIDTISHMISGEVKNSQTCALEILSTLFTCDASCRRRVLEAKGLCSALERLAAHGQWITQHHLTTCVLQLASCVARNTGHPRVKAEKVMPLPKEPEFEHVSQALAGLDSEDNRWVSIQRISSMLHLYNARVELLKHNIILRLLGMFDDGSWLVRQSAMNAISKFLQIDYPACKQFQANLLVQTLHIFDDEDHRNVLQEFIELGLVAKSISLQYSLLATLKAKHQAALRAIASEAESLKMSSPIGIIPALVQYNETNGHDFVSSVITRVLVLLGDEDEELPARQSAIDAILSMSRSEALRAKLLDSKVTDKLLNLLDDGNWDIRQGVFGAIRELLSYENVHNGFLSDEHIERIMKLLEVVEPDVRLSAIKILVKMIQLGKLFKTSLLAIVHMNNTPENAREHPIGIGATSQMVASSTDERWGTLQSDVDVAGSMALFGIVPSPLLGEKMVISILKLFEDTNQNVQESAVQGLIAIMSSSALKDLMEVIDADPKLARRCCAIRTEQDFHRPKPFGTIATQRPSATFALCQDNEVVIPEWYEPSV
ncbi:hypothetical protein HWV62_18876 [Athelia sp. TMB]|nr:hypothetical protein HWV62_18876 [Athelia sp. TMB]